MVDTVELPRRSGNTAGYAAITQRVTGVKSRRWLQLAEERAGRLHVRGLIPAVPPRLREEPDAHVPADRAHEREVDPDGFDVEHPRRRFVPAP